MKKYHHHLVFLANNKNKQLEKTEKKYQDNNRYHQRFHKYLLCSKCILCLFDNQKLQQTTCTQTNNKIDPTTIQQQFTETKQQRNNTTNNCAQQPTKRCPIVRRQFYFGLRSKMGCRHKDGESAPIVMGRGAPRTCPHKNQTSSCCCISSCLKGTLNSPSFVVLIFFLATCLSSSHQFCL